MNTLWKLVAWIASRQPVANWIIKHSQRTPYFHLVKEGNTYMRRWWLFNPYDYESRQPKHRWCPISVRVHHILRPDDDRHLHDHPWNARTIVIKGYYLEETPKQFRTLVKRGSGDTGRIGYGQFHRIHTVSKGGVYTIFISGRHRGTWGFLVDGAKVPWRKYLGLEPYRLDLVEHIARQQQFSAQAFGPGDRAQGVVDHIRKELREIEAQPKDLEEWIDVATLAFDGAWRAGHSPEEVAQALEAKLTKNEKRSWPDWRTADRNKAIEHDRIGETT